MRSASLLLVALLLATAFAGCSQPPADPTTGVEPTTTSDEPRSYADMGFDGKEWPRLDGVTLTVLDHGAFGAFDDAKRLFENRTGATVVHVEADDAGSVLRRAALEKGDPTFDVIYGIDNILWTRAIEEGVFEPYRPLLADAIDARWVFFDRDGEWPATPVDHGYIAVNVDERTLGASVASLDELRAHAGRFVTEDPRTSTPGLGFLLATIATYGEPGWKAYWTDLFEGGVLVTSGWTEAYEQHFSGGYGVDYGGLGDRAIVTSYTTSPAYEAYFGRSPDALATPLVAPKGTFHQIETMGIANGTKRLAAAQAWIEFTLTDDFQSLMASGNAMYPVVKGVSTEDVFGEHAPTPGSFEPAPFEASLLGANLERWLQEWTDLCEAHDCA